MMDPTEIKEYFKAACKDVDNGRDHIYPSLQHFSQMIKALQDCNLDINIDVHSRPTANAYNLIKDVMDPRQISIAVCGFLNFGQTSYPFSVAFGVNQTNVALLAISKYEFEQPGEARKFGSDHFYLTDQKDLARLQKCLIELSARDQQLIKNNDIGDVFNKPTGYQHPRTHTTISRVNKPAGTAKSPALKTTRS